MSGVEYNYDNDFEYDGDYQVVKDHDDDDTYDNVQNEGHDKDAESVNLLTAAPGKRAQ